MSDGIGDVGHEAEDFLNGTRPRAPVDRDALRHRGLRALTFAAFEGANVHHAKSVAAQTVDAGPLAAQDARRLGARFVARYVERFDNLKSFDDAGALRRDVVGRLEARERVAFFELALHAVLAVEMAANFIQRRMRPIDYAAISAGDVAAQATFVWSSRHPETSRLSAAAALIGLSEILPDEVRWPSTDGAPTFDAAFRSMRAVARSVRPAPPAAVMIDVAERRGVPWEFINRDILRLGQGARQHRIWSTVTSATSRVADRLSKDKVATRNILADADLPVPRQIPVETARDARRAAEKLGFPVVVKPVGGNTGKGVSANLTTAGQVATAFPGAKAVGDYVIVEDFVAGVDHRLLVVGGRLVAAAQRTPPRVVGDGVRTIAELIAEVNKDPLRDEFRRTKIKQDRELDRILRIRGVSLTSVLPDGEALLLRTTANISTGGVSVDVTDTVHPDNAEMAVCAAEAIGLDVAGIDFLTPDIAKSYKEVGGGIVEVNTRPAPRSHLWPIEGAPRDVGGAVLDTMFEDGDAGVVPLAAVVGDAPIADAVAARLTDLLSICGRHAALVSSGAGAGAGDDLRRRLRDHRVEAVVLRLPSDDVVEKGLVVDQCAASVVLDDAPSAATAAAREVLRRATSNAFVEPSPSPDARDDDDAPRRLAAYVDDAPTGAEVGGPAVVARAERGGFKVIARGLEPDGRRGSSEVAALPAATPETEARAYALAAALALGMGLSMDDLCAGAPGARRAPHGSKRRRLVSAVRSALWSPSPEENSAS